MIEDVVLTTSTAATQHEGDALCVGRHLMAVVTLWQEDALVAFLTGQWLSFRTKVNLKGSLASSNASWHLVKDSSCPPV